MKTVGLVLYIILFMLFLGSLASCSKGVKKSKGLQKEDVVSVHCSTHMQESVEHRIFLELLSDKSIKN